MTLFPGTHDTISIRPLPELMDNVLAARLGTLVREVYTLHPSDDIDRGLILQRLLQEHGFVIGLPVQSEPWHEL